VAFRVHRAAGADQLVEGLAELLPTPLADPFEQELVMVPAKGIERWLSQQLAHRLGHAPGRDDGVCAGVQFRSPCSLVSELTGTRDEDAWSPDALVWPMLGVLDASFGEEWCRALSLHLGHGQSGEDGELRRGRRYSVARRLAGLFASYAVQRPSLLADWEAGRDTDGAGAALSPDLLWQAQLWRRLVVAVAAPSPVERHTATVALLGTDPDAVDLPERLSLFGHTRVPVTEIELLAARAAHREVHLWLPHPSDPLWEALAGLSGSVPRQLDESHEQVHHPLLASLGRDVRELQRSLQRSLGTRVQATSVPPSDREGPARTTLLGWLQHDLAANSTADPSRRTIDPADRSVQVHACHGPARQVEGLREVLLGLLADDPTLEPRDILVMCPDIEAYAPLITAAFGMAAVQQDNVDTGPVAGHHPGHRLRVMQADRSLTQTNPLLAVVAHLLDIAGGRAEASRILDLLACDPVRRRFGLSDTDLETVASWVDGAGIRWSFDAAHRAEYGLESYVQNTWRFGVDRVLAGVAVSDDAERYFATTLPLDDVASTSIDLAGRLAECLDRLQRVTDDLSGEHPVGHWLDAITRGVDELTAVARGDEWQRGQLHRELRGLATDPAADGTTLRLSDVRALMGERVAGRPTRANFRTGTLTVCTMTPMRSVPHRVVCLLGVDDGVFPRGITVDGDNVLARTPLTGERDPRSEDRQLMLDAVLAARQTLVITYTGASETTGLPRPPAVPLQELLDALDLTATGGAGHALERHPLQAFDPRNLDPAQPFSFDRQALAGARAAARDRVPVPELRRTTLPPRPGDVALAELVAFFKAPVKEFLRKRLDIALPEEAEESHDGMPVELNGLQQWAIGDRMLTDLLAGRTRQHSLDREWRRGELPPGRLGWRLAGRLIDQAEPVAELVDSLRAGRRPTAVDVSVDLGSGRMLTGTVTDVFGERVVRANFSRLGPKHWLDAWLPLLALCAAHPGRGWSAGSVGRGGRGVPTARAVWGSVDDAASLLADLVAIYDAGMRGPLPLPVKTGHAWAARHGRSESWQLTDARKAWRSGKFPGEDADPAHVLVWGPDCALEELLAQRPLAGEETDGERTRLGALACRLWRPMLDRVHQ
jgi:exodeoxyribonuclease V gamma subunit